MRTTISLVSSIVLAASTACCAATHPAPTGAVPIAAAAAAPGEVRVGDRAVCPVSGEEFIVSATSPWVEHEGRIVYFCCSECARKFAAEPAKYLRNPGAGRLTGAEAPPAAPASP